MGHFPEYHVMPAVLIIEALAQTGAVAILSLDDNKGKISLFGGIKHARFKRQVIPGDVLELHCEIIKQRGPIGVGKADAYVDGELAVTAEITFAIQ
jgi:3-hydroxyacyl-[acyl-carrier-protein] dehydratase